MLLSLKKRTNLTGWLIIWILLAVLLPIVISGIALRQTKKNHGVVVHTYGTEWYEDSFEDALKTVWEKRYPSPAEIHSFLLDDSKKDVYFILNGIGKCKLYVNNQEFSKQTAAAMFATKLPSRLTDMRLVCPPQLTKTQMHFYWSNDLVTSRPVDPSHCYKNALSGREFLIEKSALWLGILGKINALLTLLFVLIMCFLRPLKNFYHNNSSEIKYLLPLLLFVLLLRVYGLNYLVEEGLHPDERVIASMITDVHLGKTPEQFWYTSGFTNIGAAVETIIRWIFGSYPTSHFIPRLVSAVASWLSCIMVYSISRFYFPFLPSLLATLLFGFSFIGIQLAHFGIVEPTMVFLFLAGVRSLLPLPYRNEKRSFIVAGFVCGLAVAVKQTAILIFIPAMTFFVLVFKHHQWKSAILRCSVFLLASLTGFFILSPYTLLKFPQFYKYQVQLLETIQGQTHNSLFYVGYSDRFRGFHVLIESIVESGAVPLFIAGIGGMFFLWKKSRQAASVFIPVMLVYCLILGMSKTTVERYTLLLFPFFAIFAATAITTIFRRSAYLATAMTIVLLLPSLYRIVVLEEILSGKDTRRKATEWCYKNIEPVSRIHHEMFGPRFLLPLFDARPVRIFKRSPWKEYKDFWHLQYFVTDSVTETLFNRDREIFALENEWYESIPSEGDLVKEFHGRRLGKYDLFNPVIRIYRLPDPL